MSVAPPLVQTVVSDIEGGGSVMNTIQEDVSAWEPMLESVKAFAGLVKEISKVCSFTLSVRLNSKKLLLDSSVRSRRGDGAFGDTTGMCVINVRNN